MSKVKRIAHVSLNKCQIHLDAQDAFIYTTKLKLQLKPSWGAIILSQDMFMPHAVYEPASNSYFIFSHWQLLMPQFSEKADNLNLLVWDRPTGDINDISWQFCAAWISQCVHRKSLLTSVNEFLNHVPMRIRNRLSHGNRVDSTKSMTAHFCKEKRSPVRTQCSFKYQSKRGK